MQKEKKKPEVEETTTEEETNNAPATQPEARKEVAKSQVSQSPAVDPKDLMLPRAELLQALSPKVTKGVAPAGKIVDNIEGTLLGEEGNFVNIVPIKFEKNFIKWMPRDQGGGIVYRTSNPNDPRVIEDVKWGPNGEKPACTQYLNFLCLAEGREMPLVVSFAITSYNTGRKLLTMVEQERMLGREIFESKYRLAGGVKTNSKGTFYIFEVDKVGPSTEEERVKASNLLKMFAGREISFEQETSNQSQSSNNYGDEF